MAKKGASNYHTVPSLEESLSMSLSVSSLSSGEPFCQEKIKAAHFIHSITIEFTEMFISYYSPGPEEF